jgi:hypothetical protein
LLAWWAKDAVKSAFPTIANFILLVIAMVPGSSAEVENSFSKLGRVQTKERLNMRDETFEALVFLYTNGKFCLENFPGLSSDEMLLLAKACMRAFQAKVNTMLGRGT